MNTDLEYVKRKTSESIKMFKKCKKEDLMCEKDLMEH